MLILLWELGGKFGAKMDGKMGRFFDDKNFRLHPCVGPDSTLIERCELCKKLWAYTALSGCVRAERRWTMRSFEATEMKRFKHETALEFRAAFPSSRTAVKDLINKL